MIVISPNARFIAVYRDNCIFIHDVISIGNSYELKLKYSDTLAIKFIGDNKVIIQDCYWLRIYTLGGWER